MGDLDAVRSGDGTRIPLKLNNAVEPESMEWG